MLDNLNTHRPASLYEAFELKEARRVIQRLEFHYTPKHGSWLNPASSTGQAMAEIEFSVFSNQCLNRRIEDEDALKREIVPPWRPSGISLRQPSTGDSPTPMPGISFAVSILRFHTDAVLLAWGLI